MNQLKILLLVVILLGTSPAFASDFDWTRHMDVRAEADREGFRARLSTRFKVGDAQVKVVLGNVARPSEAYMVFRLGEMSGRSSEYVMREYRERANQGWGALAHSLGIKPGSHEFKELKSHGDLDHEHYSGKHKNKNKQKNKGSGKNKGKK